MKKIWIITLAALVGAGFAGCSKDKKNDGPVGTATLVVKLNETVLARSLDDAATRGPLALDLPTSEIFIVDVNGNIPGHFPLTAAASDGTGQVVGEVPLTSRVYVVANIPTADYTRISTISTLASLKSATSLISLQQNRVPVAANQHGLEVSISRDPGDPSRATAELNISPVISRLELGGIQGGTDSRGSITGFTVSGIYIDHFFDKFNYSGGGTDEVIFENIGDLPTWPLRDEGEWESVDNVAQPDNNKVWAYNVAAGGLPLVIVKLTDITWIPTGGTEQDYPGEYYVTVTGYANTTVFRPGQVYRIGNIDQDTGNSDFVFTPEHLGAEPHEESAELEIIVNNIGWTLVDESVIIGD